MRRALVALLLALCCLLLGGSTPMLPERIVVHCSGTVDGPGVDTDAIRKYHTGHNGWDDIGYHLIIESVNGEVRILSGRPFQDEGAHTRGHNRSIGVCVVGDFDSQAPDEEKVAALVRTIKALFFIFPHLGPDSVYYHNEFSSKSCPGRHFISLSDLKHKLMEANNGTAGQVQPDRAGMSL